jgi:hypothetical protein
MSTRSAALLCAVALLACANDGTTGPDSGPAFNASGVSAAATGSAHLIQANGELRKFTFAAITHADGSISGQFELVAGNADLVAHGTVTCMTVIDNQAWVGGTIDRNSIGAAFTHGWFRAVDNAGSGATDQVSLLVVANNPAGDLARAFCDGTPAFPPLNDIVQGNINIR